MKPKAWTAIVIVLILINIVTLTFLWIQYKTPQRGAEGSAAKDFIIKEAGLNIKQQQQYDTLRKMHQQQIREINETDKKLHDELFKNISVADIDTAMLDSIAAQISALEIQRQKITVFHFRSLRQILNNDQQQKFDKIINEALKMMVRPAPPPSERRAQPYHFPKDELMPHEEEGILHKAGNPRIAPHN